MDHPTHAWVPGFLTASLTGGYALLNRALSVKQVHKRIDELKLEMKETRDKLDTVAVDSRTSNEMLQILVSRRTGNTKKR